MSVSIAEKQFEFEIEAALLAQGYEKGKPEDYDPALVLLPKTVVRFVQATQPKEWAKLKEQYKDDPAGGEIAKLLYTGSASFREWRASHRRGAGSASMDPSEPNNGERS